MTKEDSAVDISFSSSISLHSRKENVIAKPRKMGSGERNVRAADYIRNFSKETKVMQCYHWEYECFPKQMG